MSDMAHVRTMVSIVWLKSACRARLMSSRLAHHHSGHIGRPGKLCRGLLHTRQSMRRPSQVVPNVTLAACSNAVHRGQHGAKHLAVSVQARIHHARRLPPPIPGSVLVKGLSRGRSLRSALLTSPHHQCERRGARRVVARSLSSLLRPRTCHIYLFPLGLELVRVGLLIGARGQECVYVCVCV